MQPHSKSRSPGRLITSGPKRGLILLGGGAWRKAKPEELLAAKNRGKRISSGRTTGMKPVPRLQKKFLNNTVDDGQP